MKIMFPKATVLILSFLFVFICATGQNTQIDSLVKKDTITDIKKDFKTYNIKGIVIGDSEDDFLPGAHIYIGDEKQPVAVTDGMGEFTLKQVSEGKLILTVSFIGFENTTNEYVILSDTILPKISMKTEMLDEVLIVAVPPLITQNGDTTVFNPAAVKLPEDAELEDLLKKLPGFQVVDGKLMAQGEEVKKLYVDGKEYFINDPTTALQQLPANIVSKIKMFDDRSDEAKFSGYEDGEKFRALNIETKNPNQLKVFGRASLGYGISEDTENTFKDNNYNLNLSANAFNEKQKFSIRGGISNTNQGSKLPNSHFTDTGGNNKGKSFYMDFSQTLKKNSDLPGSYNYENRETYSASSNEQNYYPTENYESRILSSENHSWGNSTNHNVRTNFSYEINEKNRITFSPSFTYNTSDNKTLRYSSSVENNDTINVTNAKTFSNSKNHSFGSNIVWMRAFNKIGRTFTVKTNFSFRKVENNSQQQDSSFINKKDTLINLISESDRIENSISQSFSYSEPISENSRISINYSFSYRKDLSDKTSLSYKDIEFQNLIGIDSSLTNKLNNKRISNSVGLNYNLNKEKYTFNGGASFNFSNQKYSYKYLGKNDSISKSNYANISPRLDFNYSITKTQRLSIGYNGNTSSPSSSDLQDILDVSDQLRIKKGNPNLKKTYSESLNLNYNSSNFTDENFSFFSMGLGFSNTFNKRVNSTLFISNDTIINGYDVLKGATLTIPVNLNGEWSINTNASYSFEIKAIKLRFNPSINYSFSNQPNIYDNIKNTSKSHNASFNLGLNSNISENLDYNVSTISSFSKANNSTTQGTSSFSQNVTADLRWNMWKDFIIASNYSYSYYYSKTGTNNYNSLLDLSLSKKIRKRWELKFSAKDVLRQKNTVNHTDYDLYTQTSYTTNNTNYFNFSISYRYNSMNSKRKTIK